MIYTIKCRRGHCGAKHDTEDIDIGYDPSVATEFHQTIVLHGWIKDEQGWLCPFDAPKPAAEKPIEEEHPFGTFCKRGQCGNANMSTLTNRLIEDGWRASAGEWLCPACWKTTQPDPGPAMAEPAQVPFMSRGDVAMIARSEIKAALRRICDKCTPHPVDERLEALLYDEAEIPF